MRVTLATAALVALLGGCALGAPPEDTPPPADAAPTTPEDPDAASLAAAPAPRRVLDTPAPPRPLRVLIDAGHGEVGNRGNTSVLCEAEADVARALQDTTLAWLRQRPGLDLRAGRPDAAPVPYGDRIAAMDTWPADAVVSLHSDARAAEGFAPDPTSGCWGAHGQTGFAILYSDEGAAPLTTARRRLADELAAAMIEAGFPAYGGEDYPGLYDRVGDGVFVDRHTPGKRIRMLRRPKVPLVIVETHQAFDREDVARWASPEAHAAFASAVYRAVVRASGG